MTWRRKKPRDPSEEQRFLEALAKEQDRLKRPLTGKEIAELAREKGYGLTTGDEVPEKRKGEP